ncbi:uncharacterized protein cfap97d2 isoform X2 [Cynoglossus semilaevis]|nr:uncharacterized protein LOC103391819 isoform X2 [Cynoglossus semilaevis]
MDHRAYQSLFPTKSKYLQQKWDKASYSLHRSKVKQAKPAIDQIPPKTYPHLALKLKKQQLEEDRALEIQFHNNILLEKILRIKRTKGGIDSWNDYEPKRTTESYQSYQPLFPTKNKYLQQKWDKATYDLHRRKVKSSKPVIDKSAPRTYPHLEQRLKKQQLEEERTMDIQRENNLLNEKISHIKKTTGGVDSWNIFEKKRTTKNYEAYQSLFPTANRYLQHKWDKTVYDLRRRKVTSAKPSIDATPPRTFPHLEQKLKTKQLEEERRMEIHRENSILNEKIARINRTIGDTDTWNKYSKKRDNRNPRNRAMTMTKNKRTDPTTPLIPKVEPEDYDVKKESELQQDTATDPIPETDPPGITTLPGNPDS